MPFDLPGRILAADFKIGDLSASTGEGARDASDVAGAFMKALASGTVRDDLIAEDLRDLLDAALRENLPAIEDGTQGRVGTIRYEDGSAHARVRLLAASSSAEGDIYLDLREGSWVVTDIQIDLRELAQPAKETGPFFPSTYSGVLQGY